MFALQRHLLLLLTAGLVTGAHGQLGDAGDATCWATYAKLHKPADLGPTRQIEGAHGHVCALLLDESVRCWGETSMERIVVPEGIRATYIMVLDNQACAALVGTGVACWGDTAWGEPPALGPVKMVSVGGAHACALLEDGTVACWSEYSPDSAGAAFASTLTGIVEIASGWHHNCALHDTGLVTCWGQNSGGALDNMPGDLAGVEHIVAGDYMNCAVLQTGQVTCWGAVKEGAGPPSDLPPVKQLAVKGVNSCAVLQAGGVRCWGSERYSVNRLPHDDLLALGSDVEIMVGGGAGGGHYVCAVGVYPLTVTATSTTFTATSTTVTTSATATVTTRSSTETTSSTTASTTTSSTGSSTSSSSTSEPTGTTTAVPTPAPMLDPTQAPTLEHVYEHGPRVANNLFRQCSEWYGTLVDAKARCDDDPNCKALHDWNCDGKNWRYCDETAGEMQRVSHDTAACTMSKKVFDAVVSPTISPTPAPMEHLYESGPRVANNFVRQCSGWYGTLVDAKTRCDDDPNCKALHDWNCDGKNWRYCDKTTGEMPMGDDTAACTMAKKMRLLRGR